MVVAQKKLSVANMKLILVDVEVEKEVKNDQFYCYLVHPFLATQMKY